MDPPRLPWEVIERVVDHSRDLPRVPQRLALTCRQLHPRSRLVMFTRVRFKSRDHLFAFVDFLQDNPHLKLVVHSIIVRPIDLAPFPLLHLLPNLSEIAFTPHVTAENHARDTFPILHQSTLTCVQRFGFNIKTLRLHDLRFVAYLPFAQMLSAFVNITTLVCKDVVIETEGNGPPLEVIRRRLSRQMMLEAVIIDSSSLAIGYGCNACPGGLLFHPDLAPSTIESLHLIRGWQSKIQLPYPCDWSRLRSLVLQFDSGPGEVDEAAELLQHFANSPVLTKVTLEQELSSITEFAGDLSLLGVQSERQGYRKLERAILRFSQPRIIITCISQKPPCANSLLFWTRELGKHLPVLFERGALTMKSTTANPMPPGHEAHVHTLVVSRDGKWVASGSQDSTIILWETGNGMIAQQWVPHSYKPVYSLDFSPDGRYLVSAGQDRKAVIWDLSQCLRKVAMLEGHADAIWTCAWSPDGNTIATGSEDGTARLWDAHTFRQLASHSFHGRVCNLAFSPNGCWIACGSRDGECSILNASGKLHQSLWSFTPDWIDNDTSSAYTDSVSSELRRTYVDSKRRRFYRAPTITAFHPGSMRLAVAPSGSSAGITLVDVASRKSVRPFKLRGETRFEYIHNTSFSPDGTRMLRVLGAARQEVHIWDASKDVKLFRLQGHKGIVQNAHFSPCGKYIASASRDRTVRLWRTSDGSSVAMFSEHAASVEDVIFSPDGKTLSSSSWDGTVVIRRMDDILPIDSDGQDPCPLATRSAHRAFIDRILNAFGLPDDHGGLPFHEEEVDLEERHSMRQRQPLREPRKHIEPDAAGGLPRLWLRRLVAGVLVPHEDRVGKSTEVDTSMVTDGGARPYPRSTYEVASMHMAADNSRTSDSSLLSTPPTGHQASTRERRPCQKGQENAANVAMAKPNEEARMEVKVASRVQQYYKKLKSPASLILRRPRRDS